MIKEMFKNENYSFNQWIKIFKWNDFFLNIFKTTNDEKRKYLILKELKDGK